MTRSIALTFKLLAMKKQFVGYFWLNKYFCCRFWPTCEKKPGVDEANLI